MSYLKELKVFNENYKCENINVDGSTFRYVLDGKKDAKTLVFLNGGMNTLEMWMNYVGTLANEYQVLLFDYPQEVNTNPELVVGMHKFFEKNGNRKSYLCWCQRRWYDFTDLHTEIS